MYIPIIKLMIITTLVRRITSFRVGQTTFFNSSYVSRKNVTGVVMCEIQNLRQIAEPIYNRILSDTTMSVKGFASERQMPLFPSLTVLLKNIPKKVLTMMF